MLLWDPSRKAHVANAVRLDLVHFPTRSWVLEDGDWSVQTAPGLDAANP